LEAVPTATTAKRPQQTRIEYDAPVLRIVKGAKECLYDVAEFPCGFDGRAFALTHDLTGEVYHVFAARNQQDTTCSCAGFTYTSNDPTGGRCKHTDAILHLLHEGKLDDVEAGRPAESTPDTDPWADDERITLTEAGIKAVDSLNDLPC
jgi:hypothetical protein